MTPGNTLLGVSNGITGLGYFEVADSKNCRMYTSALIFKIHLKKKNDNTKDQHLQTCDMEHLIETISLLMWSLRGG